VNGCVLPVKAGVARARHCVPPARSALPGAGPPGSPQRSEDPLGRVEGRLPDERIVTLFSENLRRYLAGEQLLDRVHPTLLY
jgi:hypothetical protein